MHVFDESGNRFKKKFPDGDSLEMELQGYYFMRQHFGVPFTPMLLDVQKGEEWTLTYENIRHTRQSQPITDGLDAEIDLSAWEVTLRAMRDIQLPKAKVRQPDRHSGSRRFFIDRLQRVTPAMMEDYAGVAAASPEFQVNGLVVRLDPRLLIDLPARVDKMTEGLCVPSQGDYHERNIFTDGALVDFEGAGWNLAATDIANFIHHTLCGGNHFGPRYALWATQDHKMRLDSDFRQLEWHEGAIRLRLKPARRVALQAYIQSYVRTGDFDDAVLSQVSTALAVRFLTLFSVMDMSEADRKLVYIFANLFSQHQLFTACEHLVGCE